MQIGQISRECFGGFRPKALKQFQKIVSSRLGKLADDTFCKKNAGSVLEGLLEEKKAANWILNPKNTKNLDIFFEAESNPARSIFSAPQKLIYGNKQNSSRLIVRDKINGDYQRIYGVCKHDNGNGMFETLKDIIQNFKISQK